MENEEIKEVKKRKKVNVVQVDDENKKKLRVLKAELGHKKFNDTIKYLFFELNKPPRIEHGFQ